MLYSPRRLEALLGNPLHLVTHQQIVDLVGDPDAREAEDLDYKRLYPSRDKEQTEKGKDAIAIDIATFANHLGGLIIVGMAENGEIPSAPLEVELAGLENRIRQAGASRIHPMPRFDTRPVENPADPGRGFLLIAIPPSSLAPHAVSVPSQKESGLRWPRRHGADKVWLSESEIAAAYRRRVMAATDQAHRVAEVEKNAIATTAVTSARSRYPLPLLVVTLVPDLPGEVLMDSVTMQAFRKHTADDVVMIGAFTPTFHEVGVAHRRLIAEAGADTELAVRAELYTDGSGTFSVHPGRLTPPQQETFRVRVLDAELAVRTASALRYLARHARDRAGVNGAALLRVMLVADTHLHPAVLPAEPTTRWPYNDPSLERSLLALNTPTADGDQPLGTRLCRLAYGESVAWLDDLADDGPPLARATAHLIADLLQTFGVPENRQIRRDGSLNAHAWGPHWEAMKTWAQATGVAVADDVS
ncbi:AlbA family DNA-binding domain-containing protein [Planomonospora algeriensis]